jgi:DNA polymerase III delta prime subunit
MTTKSKSHELTAQQTARPAQRTLYLSHFTPSMMAPEDLEAMLVQREPLLSRCVDHVVESLRTGSRHHTLLVGPRGIGKTHLISLLHHRLLKTPEAKDKALVAWMREEEWGVTSFFELIMRILRTLDATYPHLGIQQKTEPLYDLTRNQAETQAEAILLATVSDKCVVILLENLDDLFDQIGDHGQKAWRAFIQNHSNMVLVCSSPSLFSAVSLQKSPFYGFFDIELLNELDFEDVVKLLGNIATQRGDLGLADFIETSEGRARIRAVHHLAEGNPRIYIIFSQFLTRESLDELVQAFMHTLDELTPYYQARMKELPSQQRKLVEYLITYKGAATVKKIAKSCFVTQQVCSSQLKQLRDKRYVRSIEQGRESYYELCEPLMRLCMEVKTQRGEPLSLFVEMLRIWYTEDQLKTQLANTTLNGNVSLIYLQKALILIESQEIEPHVIALIKDMKKENKSASLDLMYREFVSLKSKNQFFKKVQSLFSLLHLKTDEFKAESVENCESLIADSIFIVEDYLKTQSGAEEVHTLIGAIVSVLIKAFQIAPEKCTDLFDFIWSLILKYPAVSAVVLFEQSLKKPLDFDWLSGLFEFNRDAPKEIALTLGRVLRIVDAWDRALVSDSRIPLLELPREERSLLEMRFKNRRKT